MKLAWLPLLLAAPLAGCAQSGTVANRTIESIKMPVVERSILAYDVAFDTRNRLAPGYAQSLDEYLRSVGLAYGDRVGVDDRGGHGAAQRRAAVAEVIAGYGLLLDEAAPVTGGPLRPGMSRVTVTRSRAHVPGCPDWSQPSEINIEAAASSNFGCAMRSNLAEMVADPNDLISGKSYGGADSLTVEKATRAYRNAGTAAPDASTSK